MQKPNEYQKKYIINELCDLIKWHLETIDNIKEKYLSVRPLTCQMNLLHDLAVYTKDLDIDPDEWEDIYIIAGERARKEYFNMVKTIKDKQCIAKD